jgi:hypothetical protein
MGTMVLTVRSDAMALDVQVAKALGIHLNGDYMKCTFQHFATSSQQIAHVFDSCHLLKLINAFQNFQNT